MAATWGDPDRWKPGGNGPAPQPDDTGAFARTLRAMRERSAARCVGHAGSRLSQSALAELADLAPSYVSRLESGSRNPTRESVMRLAASLHLSDADRTALLASAGFMSPDSSDALLSTEPELSAALALLRNRQTPVTVRDDVRAAIALIVELARRSAA